MQVLDAMLAEGLAAIGTGTAERIPQDERYATWAARRTAEDGRVDWRHPAASVWRLIRAVGRPYPGAFTTTGTELLKLWEAEPWPEGFRHAAGPGQVIARGDSWFAVRCGDGAALRITTFDGPLPRQHATLG